MSLPRRDTAYHTYADYLSWPEDVRYELIDGVAYLMAPAPARVHQEVVLEMAYQVRGALEGKPCRTYIAPFDVRLPKTNEADARVDTVLQPDLLVVCEQAKLDERGLRGAPDWIVEVLSPATAGHDQTVKLTAYERARVPEVWLVHPADRVVMVFRLEGAAYGRPAIHETRGELGVAALPDIRIDWDRVFQPPATTAG
jgi:Uma2 family endonuclease